MHTHNFCVLFNQGDPPPPLGLRLLNFVLLNAEELGQSYTTMTTVVCLSPDSGDCYRIDVRLARTAKRTMIISTTELAHKNWLLDK